MAEQIAAVRAGFWRRGIAFVIDCTIVGLLILLVAPAAFYLTDGRVQFTGSPIKIFQCSPLQNLPPGMPPPEFQPNFGVRCKTSFFGLQVADTATIGRATKQGASTNTIQNTITVDRNGSALNAILLDWFFVPTLLLLRWWRDFRGVSPGRWFTDTHIASPGSEGRVRRLTRRYLFVALLFAAGHAFGEVVYRAAAYSGLLAGEGGMLRAFFLSSLHMLLFLPVAVWPIIRKRDVFYDSWSGTAVVLDEPLANEIAETVDDKATATPAPQ